MNIKSFHLLGINGKHYQSSHFTNNQHLEIKLKCLGQINSKNRSQNPNISKLWIIILFISSVCKKNKRHRFYLLLILFCVLNKPLWSVYHILGAMVVLGLQNEIRQVSPCSRRLQSEAAHMYRDCVHTIRKFRKCIYGLLWWFLHWYFVLKKAPMHS